jgi:hypothetical protein
MAIHADKNQYPGINPHLNSRVQQHHGGWRGFHSKHITHIADALESLLPEIQYYVAEEQSLQIGTYDAQTDVALARGQAISDVAVYQQSTPAAPGPQSELRSAAAPTLTLPVAQLVEEDEYVGSLVIYRLEDAGGEGTPVTRIELLSPANKPPGSHYKTYLSKRTQTLHNGINLVEIDYLHERQSVLPVIPSYPDQHENAYPYNIIVTDLRPNFYEGRTLVYGFGVLDAIPAVKVPLVGSDEVVVDFGQIYRQTVEISRYFRRILVDYSVEPVNFTAYHPDDQVRIRQTMRDIAERA